MKTALLLESTKDVAMPLKRIEAKMPAHRCCVRSFGILLGSDLWFGNTVSDEILDAAKTYDIVIVNGSTGLLRVLPQLRGRCIALLQEGGTFFWNRFPTEDTAAWVAAGHAADVIMMYDADHVEAWSALAGGTPTIVVSLPYNLHAEKHFIPLKQREDAVYVASSVSADRSGLLGLALVRAALPAWTIYSMLGHYGGIDLSLAAGSLRREFNATPMYWLPHEEFLDKLSHCALAINVDSTYVYGRFQVDCAAVGVPCVGSEHLPGQRQYWPELAEGSPVDVLRRYAGDHALCTDAIKHAQTRGREYHPDRVRERFEAAVRDICD